MKTGVLILIAGMLFCAPAFAASKASPERKQTELEAAVAKAASAPSADLTKIQCANLVYAGSKSSVCFADKFLSDVARETNINVGARVFSQLGLGDFISEIARLQITLARK